MQTKDNELIVWGTGTPRTFRVYWALEELDFAYQCVPIRPRTPAMEDPAFLSVSPGKKIPAFQDGPLNLVESGAIVLHLFEKHAARRPSGIEFAEIMQWSFFALMELDATALYIVRRHQGLPEVYGEAPTAVKSSIEYFDRQINVIDQTLSDAREYIVGTALSPADIFIVSCCDWAIAYDLKLPPNVYRYHSRLKELASYQRAYKRNYG